MAPGAIGFAGVALRAGLFFHHLIVGSGQLGFLAVAEHLASNLENFLFLFIQVMGDEVLKFLGRCQPAR